MTYNERRNLVTPYLGKIITAEIDRPIGHVHKKKLYSLTYRINYGFIPNVLGGDGEELDVYILGIDTPIKKFTGRVIGIIYRENDVEDKLVAAPDGKSFNKSEIMEAIFFQEQYYYTTIDALY